MKKHTYKIDSSKVKIFKEKSIFSRYKDNKINSNSFNSNSLVNAINSLLKLYFPSYCCK